MGIRLTRILMITYFVFVVHVYVACAGFAHTSELKKWSQKACPVEMGVYSCHFQGMSVRAKSLDRWTHPAVRKNPFNPAAFVQSMGTRTLMMCGDSLMLQAFIALVCRIYGSPGISSTFQIQWNFEGWLGPQNCPFPGSKHCYLKSGSCATFNGSLRICFAWHTGVAVEQPSGTGKLLSLARGLNMTNNDVILAGIGTWFFQDNITESSQSFTRAVGALLNEVSVNGLERNFMWLEASPQHFGNDRKDALGYYGHELLGEYHERINTEHAKEHIKSSKGTQCVSLPSKAQAWKADPRNRMSAVLLPESMPVVRIWDLLADLPHAHVWALNRGGERFALDCTHWCLPGPLVDIFPHALAQSFKPFTTEAPMPL